MHEIIQYFKKYPNQHKNFEYNINFFRIFCLRKQRIQLWKIKKILIHYNEETLVDTLRKANNQQVAIKLRQQ